jgi:acyl carrier protein
MADASLTADEIFTKVRDVLVEALSVDDEEVTPTAIIRDDLGAESIDFLDIQFRLEKAFDIKIPKGDMMPEDLQSNPSFVDDGNLTEAGIEELKARMPHADFSVISAGDDLDELSKLFTVQAVVNYVQRKITEQG